jgi:hypothetical protein
VIKPGTAIGVVLDKLPPGADPNDRKYTAHFAENARDVVWDYDGQTYSISGLAIKLSQFGVHANARSENGYRVFGLATDRTRSLEELRKAL